MKGLLQSTIVFLSLLGFSALLQAGVFSDMEKALMPGELTKAHAKFENDCKVCHKLLEKVPQNKLCLDCHDHKNIKQDIELAKGFHGRIPNITTRECRDCHSEHKGRDHSLVLMDATTFDHKNTDFPLRGSHRDAACDACHKSQEPFHKAPSVCVKCHEKNDIHKGKLGEKCQQCHAETRWRDFRFDHGQTKFKLEGKHTGVECRSCHPRERYSGISGKCIACHKNDDKHNGRYGQQCNDCHSPKGWVEQSFDHDKDTKYPLKGNHARVTCQQCHKQTADEKKVKLKTDCFSCHRLRDEHKGQYGKKCDSCHDEKGWDKAKFNHQKTDFPLKGRHEKVACGDCHRGDIYKEDLKTTCYSCHEFNDVHQGQQGKQCDDCHNESGWQEKVEFDHNLVKFPLLGAHAALGCEECHISGSFKDAKAQCLSCHQKDDVHRAGLGKHCDQCHYVGDWKVWEFDHDKQTDFELNGAHKGIVCQACHRGSGGEMVELRSDCQSCHLTDDVHNGEFGRHCDRCHTTKSFGDISL